MLDVPEMFEAATMVDDEKEAKAEVKRTRPGLTTLTFCGQTAERWDTRSLVEWDPLG